MREDMLFRALHRAFGGKDRNEQTKEKGSASQLYLGTIALNPKPTLKKNLPLTIIKNSKQCQMSMINDNN